MNTVLKFSQGKYTSLMTPYRWHRSAGGGWRIGMGASSFLIAEGSCFSISIGKKLFRQLEGEYLLRQRKKRPR